MTKVRLFFRISDIYLFDIAFVVIVQRNGTCVSYAGGDAHARRNLCIYRKCVSIASECAKIITRNCRPREWRAAFAGDADV